VFRARPRQFAEDLVGIARRACAEIIGRDRALVSWALHDATQMAAIVPTAMIFTSSTAGLSHARGEDTPEEHLRLGVQALYRTVCEVAGVTGLDADRG
jgi:N-carbamoyl-L-amino-acid hydrolase